MYTEHYKPASKMAPRNDMSGASTELVLFFVRTAYTEPASRTVAHLERFTRTKTPHHATNTIRSLPSYLHHPRNAKRLPYACT